MKINIFQQDFDFRNWHNELANVVNPVFFPKHGIKCFFLM